MGVGRLALALAVTAVAASAAHAAPDSAYVDWGRGLLIAGGLGVPNRQAPSPAVARGTSRRAAEDAAKKALGLAVLALPTATGAKVSGRALELLDAALTLDAQPETDGGWHVIMAVPLEAVRQVNAGGPRAITAPGDALPGVPVLVVDGVPAAATPALGWTVGGAAGATLWVDALPAWARSAPHVRASAAAAGAIAAPLPAGAGPATLFVILRPPA